MTAYTEIVSDWERYCEFIDWQPFPFQQEAALELLRFPPVADTTWARGTGKTALYGKLATFLAYRQGWTIIINAPIQGQFDEILNEARIARDKLIRHPRYPKGNRIDVRKGRILAISGSERARVQSRHGQIAIIDEKQDVLATIVGENLIGMIAPFGGCMWFCGVGGTPDSAGEVFGALADYRSKVSWEVFAEIRPSYCRSVEIARKVMLPEEFAAHFEAKPLSMASNMLIPQLVPWDGEMDREARGVNSYIGIDWGKLDLSVATLTHETPDGLFIDDWLVARGSYTSQVPQIAEWLKNVVSWDAVFAEKNGVGDGLCDFLIERVPQVSAVQVNAGWIDNKCRKLSSYSRDGKMFYNSTQDNAQIFANEIGQVKYTMTINGHVNKEAGLHSDFLSSLMLSVSEPSSVYL